MISRSRAMRSYYVTSAHFDGQGRGFVIGFDSLKAADVFARYFLLGFAEVIPWHVFYHRFPNYFA